MSTGNPAFQGDIFQDWAVSDRRSTTMTVQGTALKTIALLAIVAVTASWSWIAIGRGDFAMPMLLGSGIASFIVAMITIFRPQAAPVTAPIYAALEGVLLGAISSFFDRRFPGIAMQAVSLTMTTMFVMLVLYSTRAIRVTDRLRTGILAATGAICLLYLISFLMNVFLHRPFPYIHEAGPIGIGLSLFVVGLAAFNLLLDFDFIERASYAGAAKSMEWYGAFGLLVTLVWLYLEILRLLAKLQRR